MKKIALIIIALCSTIVCMAQNCDTLFFGMREPTIYYYGNHWVDQGVPYNLIQNVATMDLDSPIPVGREGSYEIARSFTVSFDEGIDIIGLAGVFSFGQNGVADHDLSHRLPEYLKLYVHNKDNQGEDSIYAVDSVQWELTTPRYRMEFIHNYAHYHYYPQLWEAFFDTVWHIEDSFYVSATAYNNEKECIGDIGVGPYLHAYTQIWRTMHRDIVQDAGFIRFRYINICPKPLQDYLSIGGDPFSWSPRQSRSFFAIFPIFDTTGHITYPDDPDDPYDTLSCPNVHGFRIMEQNQLSLTMVWDAGEGSVWEVSVVPQALPADSGTVTTVVYPFHTVDVYSLDTGICYAAYVRQVCDTLRSQWSDSVQFRFVGNTPVFINDFDRGYTLVSPNPAQSTVNVFSSFHIHKYELYSIKGEMMERRAIHANSTTIDVSTYPKGIYLLRLYTPFGETTHKIVVQ